MANTPFLIALQKPFRVLLGLLFLYDQHHGCVALAVSGGRMGGNLFSSSSSSSERDSPPTPVGGGWLFVGPAVGVEPEVGFLELFWRIVFLLVLYYIFTRITLFTKKTSVLKLQVGLLGKDKSLQKDLNRIAETADTSKPEGLRYVLQETTLALLRHPDYCIYGYSSVDVKRSFEEGENLFNQLSIEERSKYDVETLVNVNNIRKQNATTQRCNDFGSEYIVITIIVAAEGVEKLPSIYNSAQLKAALRKLATISSKRVKAVEVLWSPQNENDTLTEQELLEDYWLLRHL